MQDITPATAQTAQLVQSYGPAGFRIAGVDYAGSVLITASLTTGIAATSVSELTEANFARLWTLEEPLEVLLIGTGKTHEMLDPSLRATLKARGIGVDAMATGAAARTFNVLLSEERRVAALLLKPLS